MTVVTIRDVPDEVRNEIAARAGRAGQSMQEYLRALLIETVARPTMNQLIDEARRRVALAGTRIDAAEILADRDRDRR